MARIKVIQESIQGFLAMFPNEEDVVNVSKPDCGSGGVLVDVSFLEMCHE